MLEKQYAPKEKLPTPLRNDTTTNYAGQPIRIQGVPPKQILPTYSTAVKGRLEVEDKKKRRNAVSEKRKSSQPPDEPNSKLMKTLDPQMKANSNKTNALRVGKGNPEE